MVRLGRELIPRQVVEVAIQRRFRLPWQHRHATVAPLKVELEWLCAPTRCHIHRDRQLPDSDDSLTGLAQGEAVLELQRRQPPQVFLIQPVEPRQLLHHRSRQIADLLPPHLRANDTSPPVPSSAPQRGSPAPPRSAPPRSESAGRNSSSPPLYFTTSALTNNSTRCSGSPCGVKTPSRFGWPRKQRTLVCSLIV